MTSGKPTPLAEERPRPVGLNPDGSYNSIPRPRPRFYLELPHPPLAVLAAIRGGLEECAEVHGLVLDDGGKVELVLSEERVRFWSPQLSALVKESASGGSHLEARFGPHPHVWGLFLYGYGTGIMLTCAALLFGLVQLFLDMTPWGLWVTPLALMITALTYGAAYVGQGLGAGQMHDLRAFLDRAIARLGAEERRPAVATADEG